jgi:hypothetical protein
VVERVEGRDITCTAADGSSMAMRRAVSCLVQPIPGDRVLTATAGGTPYVIAVLERARGDDAPSLRIEAEGDIELIARRISLRAGVVDVVGDAMNMMGDAFNALFRRSKRIIGTDTTIAKSTTLRTGDRVAVVAGADVQHAAVASQTVDGPIAISSHTAVLTANADIRLNGERINVG